MSSPTLSTCPFTLHGWVMSVATSPMSHREDGPYIDMIRDLAIQWLSMARTVDETRVILASRCQCADEDASRPAHVDGVQLSSQLPFEQPILNIIAFFLNRLHFIKRFPSKRRFNLDAREDWPIIIEQILPHGTDVTMRGLLTWIAAGIDQLLFPRIFVVSIKIFGICAPCVLPSVITFDTILPTLILCLHSASKVFMEDPVGAPWDTATSNAYTLLASSARFVHAILEPANDTQIRLFIGAPNIRQFLIAVENGACSIASIKLKLLRQPSGSKTLVVPDNPSLDKLHALFDAIGGAVYDASPDSIELFETHSMATRWFQASKTYRSRTNDPHGVVWLRFLQIHMTSLEHQQRCQRPGCPTISCSRKKVYRKVSCCGGCRLVVYCSRQCQKLAWGYSTAPHREVCSYLRLIGSKYTISPGLFVAKAHAQSSQSELSADAMQHVVDHFDALAKAETNTSGVCFAVSLISIADFPWQSTCHTMTGRPHWCELDRRKLRFRSCGFFARPVTCLALRDLCLHI
jgi:hypothetical protein